MDDLRFDPFNWMMKSTVGGARISGKDVSVTVWKGNNISVTFRNDTYSKITTNDYLVVAIVKNRVYFKGANANQGYKTSKQAKNPRVQFHGKTAKALQPFVGQHDLFLDTNFDLYFIEKEAKE